MKLSFDTSNQSIHNLVLLVLQQSLCLYLLVSVTTVAANAVPKNRIKKPNEEVSCGKSSKDVQIFPVRGTTPAGKSITLYNVVYNKTRGLPISTTAFHDSLNKLDYSDRQDDFRKYNCTELADNRVQADCSRSFKMTPDQQMISGKKSYDRGHITPAQPFNFHQDALSKTFYCVNMAPQDPFSNQEPWRVLESNVLNFLDVGYVMSGVCAKDSGDGPTRDGIPVPNCYWKLVCYKEDGVVNVLGFIGDNSLTPKDDRDGKKQKKIETNQPRSQAEVLRISGQVRGIMQGWNEAGKVLLENRLEASQAPDVSQCAKTKILSEDAKQKWSSFIRKSRSLSLSDYK